MGAAAKSNDFNKLKIDRKEMGRADTLRYNVVIYVVEENYDRAIHELKSFIEKDSEYPRFKSRIERYVNYAVDLVNAIRAKRRFPGVHSLTMAKQQEIIDRFHDHFNELQSVLKRIEKIQEDLKLDDVRSTVLVIRAVVNSAFAIAILAFVLEGFRGLGANFYTVSLDWITTTTDSILKMLNL